MLLCSLLPNPNTRDEARRGETGIPFTTHKASNGDSHTAGWGNKGLGTWTARDAGVLTGEDERVVPTKGTVNTAA